jgi:hypothetical protein
MSANRSSEIRLDDYLNQDEYAQDPHTLWTRLRADEPIHWSDGLHETA